MAVTPQLPYVDFSEIGPQVGERVPEIKLPDQNGSVVDLHAARGKQRAIVVFYRSASW